MWPSQATPTRAPSSSVDALADRVDAADDLVARHDRKLGVRQLAVDDMQVGAADAAGLDLNADLPRPGRWVGPLLHREPLARPMRTMARIRTTPQARRAPATDRRRSA